MQESKVLKIFCGGLRRVLELFQVSHFFQVPIYVVLVFQSLCKVSFLQYLFSSFFCHVSAFFLPLLNVVPL